MDQLTITSYDYKLALWANRIKEWRVSGLAVNESAKFWLSVMNDLKNRIVEDILIASLYGLTGFPAAIAAVYPKTEL